MKELNDIKVNQGNRIGARTVPMLCGENLVEVACFGTRRGVDVARFRCRRGTGVARLVRDLEAGGSAEDLGLRGSAEEE